MRNLKKLIGLIALALTLTACDGGASTPTPAANPPAGAQATVQAPNTTTPLTKVTIALGYVPDVQFAPFYVALNKGYYADEGLDVTFQHGIVPDLIKQLGAGDEGVNFAVASGDEIIPAHLNDIPVVYVMTWYRQYPVAAASIVGKGPTLNSPADLKGKVVGVPGPYGSTYTGLLALLNAGGLTLDDITLKTIGFTQVESLATGQVDVAMVYIANEPTQLRAQGMEVSTLAVSDYMQLAANGIITNKQTLDSNPTLVASVIHATQRGITDSVKDPKGAFAQALKQVPEAGGANQERQMQVLIESTKLTQPKGDDMGAGQLIGSTDPAVWEATQDFLLDAKLITKKGNITEMFSNNFIGPANQ